MDVETKKLLNGIFVYAEILNRINLKYHSLIRDNTEKRFHENEQLFYEIISEILRILPVKKMRGRGETTELDLNSGILLLRSDIEFLLNDFQKIVGNDINKRILKDMLLVRNKFIHEPHNISAAFYVGGKTSCSMGLYYKDKLCSVSTMKIANIIFELNKVFDKIKGFFMEIVGEHEEKFKEYPCYIAMLEYNFMQYNVEYPKVPEWMLVESNEEMELVL